VSGVLSGNEAALRAFVARIVGWANRGAIEHALRSIDLSLAHHAALVLLGDPDLVPIARRIHRHTLGAERPFVVCQRQDLSSLAAVKAARGGALCLRRYRLPRDFPALVALLRDPQASTQIIVCAEARHEHPFLIRPVPIRVPPLTARASELPRIVDEYALDAIRALGAGDGAFTAADRTWVLDHDATTLPDIETATLRCVALRIAGTTTGAARRLGMSHVALSRWMSRRRTGKKGAK
jgi:hypothetical protein